ncbi:MAG TPA: hypothetical protein VMD59_03510, partial [Acidimicrobiales bacterium]|nr:hypothetical protein [Acidimicrobiales bacterium]
DAAEDHRGGSYVTQHEQYYRSLRLGAYRAPDAELAGFDVLAEVIPPAAERGIAVYAFVLENTHSGLARSVPGWPSILQVDAWGRSDTDACLRHPDYVAWWLALVEDQVMSYPLDGVMFGCERQGPLGNALGLGGFARRATPYCFCSHCTAEGDRRRIDPDRAMRGYRALLELCEGGGQPAESGPVAFLRILLTWPELLAWDQMWHDGYRALQQRLYGSLKLLRPELAVGWHIWHHNSFSPLHRAQTDLAAMVAYSDFLKPVLYNNCAGYRLLHHVERVCSTLFRGVDRSLVLELYRQTLGYEEALDLDTLAESGLSARYVAGETRRTLGEVAGRSAVYPGIDVNVAAPGHVKATTPSGLAEVAAAALDAGADGIILSRKYSEMTHENLAAVGASLRRGGFVP